MNQYILEMRQNLPLDGKILMSKQRIREWYTKNHGKVYVSFSGGKDSTVLLHLVRELYPDVPGVFCDTGLEYPEIRQFVREIDNIVWLKPKKNFKQIIDQYGYPVVSKEVAQQLYEIHTTKSEKLYHKRLYGADNKYHSGKLPNKWQFLMNAPFKISHKCCDYMKKIPAKTYEKETGNKPYIGTMAADSRFRKQSYIRYGCNSFNTSRPRSMPIAFWTNKDIWEYINLCELPISTIYSMGYKNTGCVYCAFGAHLEQQPNKFQCMAKTHPKLYEYCLNNLNMKQVLDYVGINYKIFP